MLTLSDSNMKYLASGTSTVPHLFDSTKIVSLEQQAGIPAGYVYSNSSHEIDKWVTMDQRIIMHVYQYKFLSQF